MLTTVRPGSEVRSREGRLKVTRDRYRIETLEFECRGCPGGDRMVALLVRAQGSERPAAVAWEGDGAW